LKAPARPAQFEATGAAELLLGGGFVLLLGLLLLAPEWEWAGPSGQPLIGLSLPTPLARLDLLGLAGWLLALGWLGRWWRAGRPRPTLKPLGVSLPLAGLALLVLVGAAGALDPGAALAQARGLAAAFLLFVLVRDCALPRRLLPGLLLLCGLVQALVALGQFALQRAVGLDLLGELAIRDPELSGAFVLLDGAGHRWLRAYGLSGHPNILGGFLASWLGLLLGMLVRPESGFGRRRLLAQAAWALLVPLAAALALTFSRGAWLALAVVLVASGLAAVRQRWSGPERRRLGVGALLIVATFLVVLVPLHELLKGRLDPSTNPLEGRSLAERAVEWRLAPALVADRPLLGVGGGNYGLAARAWHQALLVESPVQPAHDLLLLISAETGLLGGLAWLVLVAEPWRTVLAARNSPGELAAALALVALFAASFFDHYIWDRLQGLALLATLLGLWAAARIRSVQ
jgi:O-antigen ligase